MLTIAFADSILTGTACVENLQAHYCRFPKCGCGGRFLKWARGSRSGPYNRWCNEASMRVSPVGYA